MPAFRRICSAKLSSFYISAQRALELGALDETQKPSHTAKLYRVVGLRTRVTFPSNATGRTTNFLARTGVNAPVRGQRGTQIPVPRKVRTV